MHMLYNSDQYVVVQFDLPAEAGASDGDAQLARGGFEIVDKLARREIYIDGPVAQGFRAGVEALVETGSAPEAFDEFIAGYTQLARQPVILH